MLCPIKALCCLRILYGVTPSVIPICNSDHFAFFFPFFFDVFFSISFKIKFKLPNFAVTMVIWSCFCLYPMNYFIMTPKYVCFSDPHVIPFSGPLFSLFLLIMLLHRGLRAFPVSPGDYSTPLRYSPLSTEPGKSGKSLHIHTASPALASTECLMVE